MACAGCASWAEMATGWIKHQFEIAKPGKRISAPGPLTNQNRGSEWLIGIVHARTVARSLLRYGVTKFIVQEDAIFWHLGPEALTGLKSIATEKRKKKGPQGNHSLPW
jgi:hypothetical protein